MRVAVESAAATCNNPPLAVRESLRIAAQEQRGASLLTHEFLLQMIRSREQGLPALMASYLEQSLNLFRREGAADRRTADEDLAAMAQRMAQQHYQRWHTAQDEIDRKLEKLIAQHERD